MMEKNYSNITMTGVSSETTLFDSFIIGCSMLSVILNIFVLLIAFRYVNFNLRLEQLFVVNMSISDLIFGLMFILTIAKYSFNLPSWYCRSIYMLLWTSSITSLMFLLLLNVHKLVTLFYPLHAKIFMSKKIVTFEIFSCWILTLIVTTVYSVEPLLQVLSSTSYSCVVTDNMAFYACKVIILYILPLTLSLTTSSAIFVLVQKKARTINDASKNRKILWKRIFFVFVSTFWTGATCLPYRVTRVKIQLCMYYSVVSINETQYDYDAELIDGQAYLVSNETLELNEPSFNFNFHEHIVNCIVDFNGLLNIFLMLMIIGTVVNPLITIFTQKRYRKGVKNLLRSFCFFLKAGTKRTPNNNTSLCGLQVSSRETLFTPLQRDVSHV